MNGPQRVFLLGSFLCCGLYGGIVGLFFFAFFIKLVKEDDSTLHPLPSINFYGFAEAIGNGIAFDARGGKVGSVEDEEGIATDFSSFFGKPCFSQPLFPAAKATLGTCDSSLLYLACLVHELSHHLACALLAFDYGRDLLVDIFGIFEGRGKKYRGKCAQVAVQGVCCCWLCNVSLSLVRVLPLSEPQMHGIKGLPIFCVGHVT